MEKSRVTFQRSWPPGVYSHVTGKQGHAAQMGNFFYKKSLNMSPIFYENIPKHGSILKAESKFSLVCIGNLRRSYKWMYIWSKISTNGYLFPQNDPWKWVWVLRLGRHTSIQTKLEYPPGVMAWSNVSYPNNTICWIPSQIPKLHVCKKPHEFSIIILHLPHT